ncbi:hypothetical protein Glove_319g186 [Diversispora epigaea]|uniref:Uncharacterized protein n=1 Tax=Diversispora epigaea TaxID=1348612 RepID=A0A397HPG7_9GLOM|nr:hypothetical protein Glove_319g186 [Diversispora epigaea]
MPDADNGKNKDNNSKGKASSKKVKTKKDESSILKKFIKDLTTDVPTKVSENLETTNTGAIIFLQLSININLTKVKNEDATRNVITTAIVRVEIRKEILESKLSDEALRKKEGKS